MHIHGTQMNLSGITPYAAAAQRAVEAQRAAGVRNKLAMSAKNIDAASSLDEAAMIGKWMDGGHSQTRAAGEYHTAESGKDSDFG
jgi:hypothetical protein